jgi:hypothetical protein
LSVAAVCLAISSSADPYLLIERYLIPDGFTASPPLLTIMTIIERPLVSISLANYSSRKTELVSQLISVAEESGFFALTDHGITEDEISHMFAKSESFFSLPESIKEKYPFERTKVTPSRAGEM